MKKGKIRFSVFVQEIVRFYFKKRCRLLKPFVVLFKSRDRNSDGIVNEEQFISIVEEMSESP